MLDLRQGRIIGGQGPRSFQGQPAGLSAGDSGGGGGDPAPALPEVLHITGPLTSWTGEDGDRLVVPDDTFILLGPEVSNPAHLRARFDVQGDLSSFDLYFFFVEQYTPGVSIQGFGSYVDGSGQGGRILSGSPSSPTIGAASAGSFDSLPSGNTFTATQTEGVVDIQVVGVSGTNMRWMVRGGYYGGLLGDYVASTALSNLFYPWNLVASDAVPDTAARLGVYNKSNYTVHLYGHDCKISAFG